MTPAAIFCTLLMGYCIIFPGRRIISFHQWEIGITVVLMVTFAIMDQKCHKACVLLDSQIRSVVLLRAVLILGLGNRYFSQKCSPFRGSWLLSERWVCSLLVFTMVLVIWSWARLEEKILVEKFGEEYIRYQKETPMFIPRLRSARSHTI